MNDRPAPPEAPLAILAATSTVVPPDWKDSLINHPAAIASRRARLNAAWQDWWLEILTTAGNRP